jgi:hypothetical protein
MNDAIETGGDQFAEGADVAEITGDELDSLRRAPKSLRVKIINRDVVFLGQKLIDDMGAQKTRAAED